MRILSYIMLIFISVQVMMPCMDVICEQVEGVEFSVSLNGDDHENESGHADHCSPFCTCTCCHSNYLSTRMPFMAISEFPVKKIVLPDNEPVSSFLERIWQPPEA